MRWWRARDAARPCSDDRPHRAAGAAAREQSLALLCQGVAPPSLGTFYRSTLEMTQIAEQLLAFQLPGRDAVFRQQLVRHLTSGYHSHQYAITPAELAALGLRIARDPEAEQLAWEISLQIQEHIGGAVRDSAEHPWLDALLATRDGIDTRYTRSDGLAPRWRREHGA